MEYTDAPTQPLPAARQKPCPLCGHILPEEAQSCDQCDWEQQGVDESVEGKASDAVAVLLSVMPGLGHIYKGYKVIGLLLMFVGTPMAVGLAGLIATFTAGFGLGLLPIFWFGVMFHVWGIEDRVTPNQPKQDPGEEY